MATNWLVVELDEGADEGVVKVIPSEELAQEHIAARINAGIAPPRLKLYSGSDTPFGVTYQPIISIGTDGPKAPKPQGFTTASADTPASPNGAAPAKEPAAVGATAGDKQPAGTQDGVRMSSQFPPA